MGAYYFDDLLTAETVGELVAVALLRPDLAQRHFEEGWFVPWLHDQGRHDLAALAERDRTRSDGLQRFLAAATGRAHDPNG